MRRNSQAGCFHTALTKPKTIPLTGEPRQQEALQKRSSSILTNGLIVDRNRHWRFAVTDTLREQKVDERVLHLCDLTLLTTTDVYDRDYKVCCVQILGDANRAKHLRSIAAFGHPNQPLQPRVQTPSRLHVETPTTMELLYVDHSMVATLVGASPA